MNIRRISSESGLPVALEALKQDLRIDDDDFDATLERMSATAAGLIERRSGYVLVPGALRGARRFLRHLDARLLVDHAHAARASGARPSASSSLSRL
jgi:hypothetical protein